MLDDGGADDGDCFFSTDEHGMCFQRHGAAAGVARATTWHGAWDMAAGLLLLLPLLLLLYPENHDKCYYDGPSFGYGDDRRPSTIVDRLR